MSKCQPLLNFGLLAVAKYEGSSDPKFTKSYISGTDRGSPHNEDFVTL